MVSAVWRCGPAATAVMVLAACTPQAIRGTGPKPQPEPAQAPPSAAALAPARAGEAVCASPPESGEVLEGAISETGLHFYEVRSLTDERAVVKLRQGSGGPLVVAVYVGPGKTVQIGPLEDGTYRLSYALGRALAPDCRHLDFPSSYGQEASPQVLSAGEANGRRVGRTVKMTLDDGESEGPQALTAEKFNAP